MNVSITDLIILALASFRITRLFVYDTIFASVRAPFFTEVEEEGEVYLVPNSKVGQLLSCHWCTGFWCSILVVISFWLYDINVVILIFATAGLSSLLQWLLQND